MSERWKTSISGYCDDCDIDIPKLDRTRDNGNTLILEYTCPKCGKTWDDYYEFMERKEVSP